MCDPPVLSVSPFTQVALQAEKYASEQWGKCQRNGTSGRGQLDYIRGTVSSVVAMAALGVALGMVRIVVLVVAVTTVVTA